METLEDIGSNKGLYGREFFLCTNNMVSESIAMSGSSRLETLYDLVVQLHCFSIRYTCQVRFIHVSGMRMIGQRTDVLSRGSLYKGVMKVKPMLLFLPLGELVLKRSEPLARFDRALVF